MEKKSIHMQSTKSSTIKGLILYQKKEFSTKMWKTNKYVKKTMDNYSTFMVDNP